MRETAPREYRRFRDFAYAQMKKENPDIYRETKAEYDAAGQYEDNHGIMEEIAAQYAEKIDAEQFAKMLDDDRNMARKLLDLLRDLWHDITSVFSKNSRERKEYDERLALFERMLHASERESAYMRRKKQTVDAEGGIRQAWDGTKYDVKKKSKNRDAIDNIDNEMYNEDEELQEGGEVYGKGTVLFSRGRMGIPAENQRRDGSGGNRRISDFERNSNEGRVGSRNYRQIRTEDHEGRRLEKPLQELLAQTAIKNKNGEVIAVYHVTPEMYFTKFEIGDIGFHFGSIKQILKHADHRKIYNGRVFRVYLNIKNPFYINFDIMNWHANSVAAWFNRFGIFDNELFNLIEKECKEGLQYDGKAAAHIRKVLEERGFDGIVYENDYESSGKSYIAFYDDQVINTEITEFQNGIENFNTSGKASLKKNFAASGDFDIQMGENGEMIVNFKSERRKEAESRRAFAKANDERIARDYGTESLEQQMQQILNEDAPQSEYDLGVEGRSNEYKVMTILVRYWSNSVNVLTVHIML